MCTTPPCIDLDLSAHPGNVFPVLILKPLLLYIESTFMFVTTCQGIISPRGEGLISTMERESLSPALPPVASLQLPASRDLRQAHPKLYTLNPRVYRARLEFFFGEIFLPVILVQFQYRHTIDYGLQSYPSLGLRDPGIVL